MDNFYRIENRRHDFEAVPTATSALDQFVNLHRRRIEPWLSAIFQSEHLGLLVGGGFSVGLAASIGSAGAGMAQTGLAATAAGLVVTRRCAAACPCRADAAAYKGVGFVRFFYVWMVVVLAIELWVAALTFSA